jgi:hypothetical protein
MKEMTIPQIISKTHIMLITKLLKNKLMLFKKKNPKMMALIHSKMMNKLKTTLQHQKKMTAKLMKLHQNILMILKLRKMHQLLNLQVSFNLMMMKRNQHQRLMMLNMIAAIKMLMMIFKKMITQEITIKAQLNQLRTILLNMLMNLLQLMKQQTKMM